MATGRENSLNIISTTNRPLRQRATLPHRRQAGDWFTGTRHACVPCVKSDMSLDMSQLLMALPIAGMAWAGGLCFGELRILLHMQHADCWGTMRNMQDLSHVAWARMTRGLYPSAGGSMLRRFQVPKFQVPGHLCIDYPPPPFSTMVPPQHRLVNPLRSRGREEWWGLELCRVLVGPGHGSPLLGPSAEPRLHSSAVQYSHGS